ncbi:rCG25204 [Rattus norvegicus]|uniref:RCG25204 n=1 Tax=Rattus norvegicus TaxID=10116 RepID=A6I249_RAT|nr:rCG25204 [Rattus norvegicus]
MRTAGMARVVPQRQHKPQSHVPDNG